MIQRILWIAAKELRMFLRDARRLVLLIGLPALLYPILFLGSASLSASGMKTLEEKELIVYWNPPLPADVMKGLEALEQVRLLKGPPANTDKYDALVYADGPYEPSLTTPVVVEVDGASENSFIVSRRLINPLQKEREAVLRERLVLYGVPEAQTRPGKIWKADSASEKKKSGFILSRMIAPILIIMILLGVFYPALEVTVGEKEKKTLRTLMCAPVDRLSLVLGKVLAVSLIGMLAAMGNLIGIFVCASIGLRGITEIHIGIGELIPLILILLPLVLYIAVGMMAVASFTQTEQEAQTLLSPLVFLCVLPAGAIALPGIEVTLGRLMIPFFGPALAIRELFAGTLLWEQLGVSILGASLFLVAMTLLAMRVFTVETLMTGRVPLPAKTRNRLDPFDAFILILAMAASMVWVPALLGVSVQDMGLTEFLLAPAVAFGILPVLFVVLRTRKWWQGLGFFMERPAGSGHLLLGALAMIPGFMFVGQAFVRQFVKPTEIDSWEIMMERIINAPPLFVILSLVLFPAVLEEIAFRGAIQRAFTQKSPRGVWIAAALFGAFHGSLIRFPPTFVLGLLAGFVAYRIGSVIPAILIHATYNSAVIGWMMYLDHQSNLGDGVPQSQSGLLVASCVGFIFGVALFTWGWRRGKNNSGPQSADSLL
jgi:sodium transport system permease protein